MKSMYMVITLGLGTAITVLVSLGCSYWFFFSLMGGEGLQAIGAGIAGCAIQLFGYGFAVSYLGLHRAFQLVLCIVPLALSMLSTYSALYGFLSHKQAMVDVDRQQQTVVLKILEQSAKDKALAAAAAEQGIGEQYRTQAKKFLELNDQARAKDEALLERLEGQQTQAGRATPLDGLVNVTGDSRLTTIIFCAWLALMFDLLPVIAIASLSRQNKVTNLPETSSSVLTEQFTQIDTLDPIDVPVQPQEPEVTVKAKAGHAPKPNDIVEPASPDSEDLDFERVAMMEIANENLKPSCRAVQERYGWGRKRASNVLNRCVDEGLLYREGNRYKRVSNITPIRQVQAVGA